MLLSFSEPNASLAHAWKMRQLVVDSCSSVVPEPILPWALTASTCQSICAAE